MSRSALSHNKVEYIFNTSFELYAIIDTIVICMIWRLFLIYQDTAINQKPELAKGVWGNLAKNSSTLFFIIVVST